MNTNLAISVTGLLAALVTLVGSFKTRRKVAARLLGATVAVVVVTLLAVFVVVPYLHGTPPPAAAIESPAAGETIGRPQTVGARLNAPLPQGQTIWLGYQNEKGGPFVVQASKCTTIAQILDCGPLYVGHDNKDPAEFRILLATADTAATTTLSAHGPANPGDNLSYRDLPAGTTIIAQQRHITLR
jgi:hypothetical protein